ncbi:MAG: hypothetical protein GYB31_09095 [Bacteroidetes bacterium]|nr:hypothetical protein [Bacteroidota bacterium]
MRTILISTIFLLIGMPFAKAQHCPFDNMAILVVDVIKAKSGVAPDPVQISLCDSLGQTIDGWHGEPLIFVPNPERTNAEWDLRSFNTIRYGFAEDHFILPLSHSLKKEALYIKVEYTGMVEEKFFLHRLSPNDFFDLHENIGDWTETFTRPQTPEVPFDKLIQITLP